MSTHNIQFHDKIRKNPLIFVFLSYWKSCVGTEKSVRIIHGKRAIRVRAIEVSKVSSFQLDLWVYVHIIFCRYWVALYKYVLICFKFHVDIQQQHSNSFATPLVHVLLIFPWNHLRLHFSKATRNNILPSACLYQEYWNSLVSFYK